LELSAHHPGEPGRIDGELEGLFSVDLDDRDTDPVFELQLFIGFDVDLFESEPEPLALRQDGLTSHVAEVTARPGVEDDLVHRALRHGALRHGALGHGAPWHEAMVASGARKMRDGDREDLQLHRRLSAGDRGAFDELYRKYSPTAYGIAYRLTGQQLLAQDVVHDAFLALWRAPEAFDATRGAFRSFFLSLVHHRAVDTIRREERLRARQERAANLEPAVGEDPSERVVDDDFVARRRSEVRDALADLSAEQRQVLEMAYFAGKTQVRIAEELGIPLGTVKTRTFAALRKLRRALETED
jgi:RNA polymerase sigma factor (sigma-70 family)